MPKQVGNIIISAKAITNISCLGLIIPLLDFINLMESASLDRFLKRVKNDLGANLDPEYQRKRKERLDLEIFLSEKERQSNRIGLKRLRGGEVGKPGGGRGRKAKSGAGE